MNKRKLSSYQKLKNELQVARKEIRRLKDVIADNNTDELRIIKKCTLMERDIEKVSWLGNANEFMEKYSGFLTITNE